MTEAAKGLDYYIEHPDELPEHYSLEQLQDLAEGNEVAEAEKEPPQTEETSETVVTEEEQPAEEEETDEARDEAPIQSKDGKHTIPYAVLSKEREQRQAAEAAIQTLTAKLAAMEAGSETPGDAVSEIVSDEELAELREDFPPLAKVLDKLVGKIGELEGQLTQDRSKEQERTATATQTTVQDLIDANPTLSYWQNENAEMFTKATQFDDLLRLDPANANLSVEQRFSKVVAAMEAVHGKTELPASYKPVATESKENIAERAQKIVDKVPASKPKTLSEIPGGTPPKADEMENIAEMSPGNLEAMMAKMNPTQIAELLSKFG